LRETDRTEPLDQQCLGIAHGPLQGFIDELLDRAVRVGMLIADRENLRSSDRTVNIEQGDALKIARDDPATAMSLVRADIACVAQASHRATNDDRICPKHCADRLGSHRTFVPRHVEHDMQHPGKAAVVSHGQILSVLPSVGKCSVSCYI
jgi:hypothetical protein